MTDRADVVIAGAGLAGACAALVLSRDRRVVVLEAERPAAGASGAAAGLANPFMGRKAKPAWRHDEALDALAELTAEAGAGLFRRTGILRPAASAAQAGRFAERAEAHAEVGWLSPGASAERWPLVRSPFGTLVVTCGGSVDLPAFVEAALAVAEARGSEVVRARLLDWRREPTGMNAITDNGEVQARHLLLALGDGLRQLAAPPLPLHRVKGQTVLLARPDALPPDHPAVVGAGYAVPRADGVVVGSTFEHAFSDVAPDASLDAELAAKGAALLPALHGARVLDRRAGVRLTVPTAVSPRRLPLAGPLPGHDGVWILTGLGAKGLLTAPLLARRLPAALDGARPLPPEVAVPGFV